MSEIESVEPIGEPERDEIALPLDAQQLHAEIDQARAATDRFRSKATELIKELRDKVFKGSDVVVHLCDDHLKTLRVISVP